MALIIVIVNSIQQRSVNHVITDKLKFSLAAPTNIAGRREVQDKWSASVIKADLFGRSCCHFKGWGE